MTEEEYAAFQASGGDKAFLKKFMGLAEGEEIEAWEKASTVYAADSDDEQVNKAKIGKLMDIFNYWNLRYIAAEFMILPKV